MAEHRSTSWKGSGEGDKADELVFNRLQGNKLGCYAHLFTEQLVAATASSQPYPLLHAEHHQDRRGDANHVADSWHADEDPQSESATLALHSEFDSAQMGSQEQGKTGYTVTYVATCKCVDLIKTGH